MKLRANATESERQHVLETARKAGAAATRPLFPNAPDPELADFYTVDAKDDEAARRLLKVLSKHQSVESVEPEIKRTLKRS